MRFLKYTIFILLMLSQKAQAQPGFIGFDTTICGSPMTDSYSFSNWSSGMGSGTIYGFTIYRNGSPVYSMSGSMSGSVYGAELIFINDSTGFMAYRVAGYGHQLKKTSDYGTSWTLIGNG